MVNRKVVNAFALLIAAGFFSTKGPRALQDEVTSLTGELDRIPEAAANAGAQLASLAGSKPERAGRHLGFDTYQYPGDDVMKAWQAEGSPYEWVGYYLPAAPCHKGTSWAGKRQRLLDMGWGLAVIYVGQQTWGGTPSDHETRYRKETRYVNVKKRVKQRYRSNGKLRTRYVTRTVRQKRVRSIPYKVAFDPDKYTIDECNRNLPSTERGVMEGKDAISSTIGEGFPDGTVIYLDLEYMPHVPQRYRDYYVAWTKEVLADGRFTPGYYVHKSNATLVHQDVSAAFAEAGRTDAPNFWIAGGKDFHEDRKPEEIGLHFATAWQGKLDIVQRWAGFRLPIDVNVAATPSPSLASTIGSAVAD